MKWKIDSSDQWLDHHLACCECGWRQFATSYDTALERLRLHELHIHPESVNVRRWHQIKNKPVKPRATRRKENSRPKSSRP